MLRVVGDLLKRPGRGAEQKIVDDLRVLKRERCENPWYREDHVSVGHGQHVGLACFEPGYLGAALTLRTVAVPARVVGDPLVSAGVARVDVATQPRRPARGDPLDDRSLLPAPWRTATLGFTSQVAFEDLRDLVPRSLGHLLGARKHSAQRVQGTPGASQSLRRHMGIDLRGPERAMTEQRLDHAQVRARLH